MENNFMWVWWTLTLAICLWKLGEGLFRPQRMLEWPFLACAMWTYFYGYMAYDAKTYLSAYLGNGIADLGQLMPLLCLIGILAGWHLATRRPGQLVPENRTYPYFNFWLAGIALLGIGAAGAYSVVRAAGAGTLDFQDSSGYWILLFYVGYPGLAIAVWALFRMKAKGRIILWTITALAFIAFMAPHVMNARRGPLFPAIMVLLLVPPIARRRSPNPLIFCGSLVLVGLVMLAFLQIRVITYNGGTWKEAIQELDLGQAVVEKNEQADDNEYVISCQLIATIYQNGKYQYGSGHLSLLWHWIPRSLWKDKPTLGEGTYSFDEMFDDVEAVTGVHLLGTGAAPGGVAESFVQYGVFCPLFWMGLSWGAGAVYVRAQGGNSPRWLFCYVGFICASHWLVSQNFAASFVPFMFFEVPPAIVFLFLDSSYYRTILSTQKWQPTARPARRSAIQPLPGGPS